MVGKSSTTCGHPQSAVDNSTSASRGRPCCRRRAVGDKSSSTSHGRRVAGGRSPSTLRRRPIVVDERPSSSRRRQIATWTSFSARRRQQVVIDKPSFDESPVPSHELKRRRRQVVVAQLSSKTRLGKAWTTDMSPSTTDWRRPTVGYESSSNSGRPHAVFGEPPTADRRRRIFIDKLAVGKSPS